MVRKTTYNEISWCKMNLDITQPLQLKNGMKVKNIRLGATGKSIVGYFQNPYLGNNWFPHYWTLAGKSHYDTGFDLVYKQKDEKQ